jgi:ABC transporter permease protein
LDLSQKAGLVKRIRGNLQIVLPLIFSSLERIDTISTAMELRRFGRYKKRTWYVHKSLIKQDYLVIVSAILLLGISIGLIFFNHGRFYNPWG